MFLGGVGTSLSGHLKSLQTYIKGFLSFVLLEWVELTDGGISEWACGGGRQVITSWSQSRPTEQGMTLIQ